ncbi:MAG: DUF3375 domain-containing protein [Bryobacterales bacterium]|nr:DUF3375 domain-containing protein [Bryobacterales bacterium]
MDWDYGTLERLRRDHPAWRLLRSDHAPLVAGFLYRAFVEHNNRVLPESALAERLEDELFGLREIYGEDKFPKRAAEYLDDWTLPDRAWLRKFYQDGTDEPHFDLTPATEKAIIWLGSLSQRSFVGTESRLVLVFGLLRQIAAGAEADPVRRVEDLQRRKREIEREIERAERGDVKPLDATAIKERFHQVTQLSRRLLSDFREVEHNFRALDQQFRESVAGGSDTKKELLNASFGRHDEISDSDQGRSLRAFWDFLAADDRSEEFSGLLDRVLGVPAVQEMKPDVRLRRIHHEWLAAAEHVQSTVRRLSAQLRRFLDDRVQLENRRIMDLLQRIEKKALALRASTPKDPVAEIDRVAPSIRLLLERPLQPLDRTVTIRDVELKAGDENVDISALYCQSVIDKEALVAHVRRALESRPQVTLGELCEIRPPKQGLAEVLAYLQLAGDSLPAAIDDSHHETITWRTTGRDGGPVVRAARVPRVIFVS